MNERWVKCGRMVLGSVGLSGGVDQFQIVGDQTEEYKSYYLSPLLDG